MLNIGDKWLRCALFASCITFSFLTLGQATQDASALCDAAAGVAAQNTGVPVAVLQAITRTETGRKQPGGAGFQPWPWAINQGGKGEWFATPDEALQFASDQVAQGVGNIDIGCFQLNYRWHSNGFADLHAMFNPQENANYAARYLLQQYQAHGDWSVAAGAYHSGTPEYAERYRIKFDAIYADINEQAPTTVVDAPAARENGFPLLLAQGAAVGGSLVPLGSGGVRLIGAP